MGILKGIKKVGSAIKGGARAAGKAVDPSRIAASAIDKAVDRLKDDQFHLQGSIESEITLFGLPIGSIVSKAAFVASAADKKEDA